MNRTCQAVAEEKEEDGALVPARGSKIVAGNVQIERLEYGKLCQSPDGRVVRDRERVVEHAQLGRSDGFPLEVARQAEPSRLGDSLQAFDQFPADCAYSTVLRPVVTADGTFPVLYRIRRQPEDGVGGRERLYTMARYATSSSEDRADPGMLLLAMLSAVNSEPMRGMTRADLLAPLPPFSVRADPLIVDPEVRSFANEALIWAASGVPIAVLGQMTEKAFFHRIAVLISLMPQESAALVSAGWGVGNSIVGQLMVSYSVQSNAYTATFSVRDQQWMPPARMRVIHGNQLVDKPFTDDRRSVGRAYERAVNSKSPIMPLATAYEGPELPPLPGLDDAATVAALRWPGVVARDRLILHGLRAQFSRGETPEIDPGKLTLPEAKRAAFRIAVDALASPQSSKPAQALLLRLIQRGPHDALTDVHASYTGPGYKLLEVLLALRSGVEENIAAALLPAAEYHELEELEESVERFIAEYLTRGLQTPNPTVKEIHWRLLGLTAPPPVYQRWIGLNALQLAFYLEEMCRPQEGAAALEKLAGLTSEVVVKMLRKWAAREMPDDHDFKVISQMDVALQLRLCARVEAAWNDVASPAPEARREMIYPWIIKLPVQPNGVLLKVLSGTNIFGTNADWKELNGEILREGVPLFGLSRFAELSLMHWPKVLTPGFARTGQWPRIIALWPAAARELLQLGASGHESGNAPAIPPQALWDWQYDARDLETLLMRLPMAGLSADASLLLWSWTQNARPPVGIRVAMCRWLGLGQYLETLEPEESDIQAVLALVKECDRQPRLVSLDQSWNSASKGWQIRLLLDLYHTADLIPAPQQLTALIRHRAWLRDHLAAKGIHARRKRHFDLATSEFYERTFSPQVKQNWETDEMKRGLWAAYRGVPVHLQGNLADTLRLYEASLKEQLRLCLTYLQDSSEDKNETQRRVLTQVLIPCLQGTFTESMLVCLIQSVQAEMGVGRKWALFKSAYLLGSLNPEGEKPWVFQGDILALTPWFKSFLVDFLKRTQGAPLESWISDFYKGRRQERD